MRSVLEKASLPSNPFICTICAPRISGPELEQFVVCYKQSESEGNVHFIWYGSAILSHRFLSAYSCDNMHEIKNTDLKSINI